jgi:hypothetical protein
MGEGSGFGVQGSAGGSGVGGRMSAERVSIENFKVVIASYQLDNKKFNLQFAIVIYQFAIQSGFTTHYSALISVPEP